MTAPRPNTAAEVAALRATIEAFMTYQQAAQADAKVIRAQILSDIGVIHDEAAEVQNRVANLEGQMVEANKVVSSVNSWKSKASGAAIVLGFMGTVAFFVWQAVKEKIIAALFGG